MRLLDRDRRWVLVSRYVSKEQVIDSEGRMTGRYEVSRSDPEPVLVSVSAAKGNARDSVFGQSLDYDRTILLDDPSFDIGEASVLWIDCIDGSSDDAPVTEEPYDYVVERVARTPSYTAVAVKRVNTP